MKTIFFPPFANENESDFIYIRILHMKDTYLTAAKSVSYTDKIGIFTELLTNYSSGANIGSQDGSMIGFCSSNFIMSAGTYFFSTTTRNI